MKKQSITLFESLGNDYAKSCNKLESDEEQENELNRMAKNLFCYDIKRIFLTQLHTNFGLTFCLT